MCKVSVLVPVYNTQLYLKQCLESIKQQTLKDIEVICINDGSTDDSLSVLNEYALLDKRFKIIDKKNTGYGNSMNMGLDAAYGEYIGIVESDDFVELDMFENLYYTAKLNDADLVKGNYYSYKNGVNNIQKPLQYGPYNNCFTPRVDEKALFLRGQSIWSGIYRRLLLTENKIRFLESPGASYQDISFYFLTMACAERVVLLENAYLHYRQDNPNSSVKSKLKVFCVCNEIKAIWDFLDKRCDIREDLKYILPEFQWIIYQWNLDRLPHNQKIIFMERVYKDYYFLLKKGLLKKECWVNKFAFDKLMQMVENKDLFLLNSYVMEQMVYLYRKYIWRELKTCSQIYVYGAGVIGREIVECLQKRKFHPKGILVSSLEENPSNLLGCQVVAADDLNVEENDEILIIVAVKEINQFTIIKKLLNRGFKRVMALNNEIRFALNYDGNGEYV